MITMWTYIAQNTKKKPLNALIRPWLPCFGFFLYPKNKREIPKMLPDIISGIPKIVPDN